MKSFTALALALLSVTGPSAVAAGASSNFHGLNARSGPAAVQHHRRHHVRRASPASAQQGSSQRLAKRASKKCKSSTKKKAKATSTASASAATATSTKKTSKTAHCPTGSVVVNGVCMGMLPDGGSDGGAKNTLVQLNSLISSTNTKHAYFGQYAQVRDSSWDASQLTQIMDDLKASGAVFQPAVMPTAGWAGFTESDNSAAQQVCKQMKLFTDEGIETWLRFAHECNWYITDGTYQGSLEDCKTGFAVVAQACKEIAPEVKLFWTPNAGDIGTFEQMWPGSENVDYIGIDYYPQQGSDLSSAFVNMMQPLHDKYTSSEGPFMAIGETGLAYEGSDDEKIQFLKSMFDSATSALPNLKGVSWFNYIKNSEAGNFKVLDPDSDSSIKAYISAIAS